MTPFTGRAIGLFFAALWLLLGAAALPGPWHPLVAVAGLVAIGGLAVRAWRLKEPRTGVFRMHRYGIAVVAEIGVIVFATQLLQRAGLTAYVWPVVGAIVGLHFIGLWWAGGGDSYLWLAGVMTAVNGVALLLPTGAAMQAAAGLGSAATLAWFAGTGQRR